MVNRFYKLVVLVLVVLACLGPGVLASAEGESISQDLYNLLTRSIDVLQQMVFSYQTTQAVDYLDSGTRNFFLELVDHKHSGVYNIGQICDIWDYCCSHWTYVSDPDQYEYIAPASESIANGLHGDCEDFAVLIAAGIKAIGGTAWIVVQREGSIGHAFAQVYIESEAYLEETIMPYLAARYEETPRTDTTRRPRSWDNRSLFQTSFTVWYSTSPNYGVWLNLDYTAPHPGGRFLFDNGEPVNLIPFWGPGSEPSLKSPKDANY
jgi:hypothetical protein